MLLYCVYARPLPSDTSAMPMIHRSRRFSVLALQGLMWVLGATLALGVQAADKSPASKKRPVAVQKVERKHKEVPARTAKAVPTRTANAQPPKQASRPPQKQAVKHAQKRDNARTQRVAERSSPKAKTQQTARTTGRTQTASSQPTPSRSKVAASSPQRLVQVSAPARVSNGQQLGLRAADDPLSLSSSVALVMDQKTGEILFSKNDSAVLPIASLTKLMTGLVIADAQLPMDDIITITQDDVDTYKGSRSRLSVGSRLTRGELLHLALMSSENRAAHALGRTYPGGMAQFVRQMNLKARDLGMLDTRFVEPTGLLSQNKSSARDLATLAAVSYERPILRDLSTSPSHQLELGSRTLEYRNSNRLISNPSWDIGLQKTGYISEAGRCLVMQARVAGRELIMVFLDASGSLARAQDAERIRHWVEAQGMVRELTRPQG